MPGVRKYSPNHPLPSFPSLSIAIFLSIKRCQERLPLIRFFLNIAPDALAQGKRFFKNFLKKRKEQKQEQQQQQHQQEGTTQQTQPPPGTSTEQQYGGGQQQQQATPTTSAPAPAAGMAPTPTSTMGTSGRAGGQVKTGELWEWRVLSAAQRAIC